MFGLNPVASGILTGGITGAATGFMIGGPVGAAVGFGVGGALGAGSAEEAEKTKRMAASALTKDKENAMANQNALVADEYNKKKAARGLSDAVANPAKAQGLQQSGAVLSSVTNTSEQINLLG